MNLKCVPDWGGVKDSRPCFVFAVNWKYMCCFRESVQREVEGAEFVLFYSWYRQLHCRLPKKGRVEDAFARCLLRWIDLIVPTRGFKALQDHWRGQGHKSLEILYTLEGVDALQSCMKSFVCWTCSVDRISGGLSSCQSGSHDRGQHRSGDSQSDFCWDGDREESWRNLSPTFMAQLKLQQSLTHDSPSQVSILPCLITSKASLPI